MSKKPHIMIVQAPYYEEVLDNLLEGARAELAKIEATYEIFDVPGALEIPAAVKMAVRGADFNLDRQPFDGFIALGCVIRGETTHYDYICAEAFRGLQSLAIDYALAIGNGIITCENWEQAIERSRIGGKNKGGEAGKACVRMMELKKTFGLSPAE